MTPAIEELRQKIDSIEDSLISILNERAKCVLEIGKIKKSQNLPVADSKRVEIILKRVAEKNPGPMSNEFMVDIFKKIIDESMRLESQV